MLGSWHAWSSMATSLRPRRERPHWELLWQGHQPKVVTFRPCKLTGVDRDSHDLAQTLKKSMLVNVLKFSAYDLMNYFIFCYFRRRFRSQTSENMARWKSRGGKSMEESENRKSQEKEDQRRERVRRKKMQVREKVEK